MKSLVSTVTAAWRQLSFSVLFSLHKDAVLDFFRALLCVCLGGLNFAWFNVARDDGICTGEQSMVSGMFKAGVCCCRPVILDVSDRISGCKLKL